MGDRSKRDLCVRRPLPVCHGSQFRKSRVRGESRLRRLHLFPVLLQKQRPRRSAASALVGALQARPQAHVAAAPLAPFSGAPTKQRPRRSAASATRVSESVSHMAWIVIMPTAGHAAPLHANAAIHAALPTRPTSGEIFSSHSGPPPPITNLLRSIHLWCTAAHSASVRK